MNDPVPGKQGQDSGDRRIRIRKGMVLSFLFLLLGPAVSISQQEPAQKILRHDAAAIVKLVPVRVLDRAGRPVAGLKKEDFVLYDNQERKTIPNSRSTTLPISARL